MGDQAETDFSYLAKRRGGEVKEANREENINKHWDFKISENQAEHRVDVKARKRILRHSQSVQDEWIWIELHGVRPYDEGWLYAGIADLLAFETHQSYVIVKRDDLILKVDDVVDKDSMVTKSSECKYKVYSRPGRPDLLSFINIRDIREITWEEWIKN